MKMINIQDIEKACERNKQQKIPQHTLEGLIRYKDNGIPPGDFLYHVLINDFLGAYRTADDLNIANMFAIAKYIYNDMPMSAYGSPEKINAWMELKSK